MDSLPIRMAVCPVSPPNDPAIVHSREILAHRRGTIVRIYGCKLMLFYASTSSRNQRSTRIRSRIRLVQIVVRLASCMRHSNARYGRWIPSEKHCKPLTMKSIVFVLFAVALAVSFNDAFSDFEARYGKNYLPAERAFRAKVFEYNMKWATKMNAQNHPYTVGATPFADMTNTEFATSKMCGCMLKPTMRKPATPISTPALEAVDWREKGAVTPVKNQASCGSCWAFSATGSLEGGNFVANGKLISLSEQQLVDCDKKSNGCGGGLMDNAFKYVMEKGLCTEEDYPYHAKDETCKDDKCTAAIHIKGFEDVPEEDGEALKQAVSKAPVSVAVEADSAVFQMYTGGVVDSTACGTSLNHGVLAVGYTDEYWIVKNSWGPSWGDKGYIKIAYKATGAGICGINQMNSYPTF